MWSVVLKILSILGIILLCLLALAVAALLLVLFCPVSYRGGGSARAGKYRAWFRFRWLFGLVRGFYAYPDSGSLKVKLLWLTVYDSGGKQEKASPEDKLSRQVAEAEEREQSGKGEAEVEGRTQPERTAARTEKQAPSEQTAIKTEKQAPLEQTAIKTEKQAPLEQTAIKTGEQAPSEQTAIKTEKQAPLEQTAIKTGEQVPSEQAAIEAEGQNSPNPAASGEAWPDEAKEAPADKLSGLKDKLTFYLEIVRDEENQELVKHGLTRLGKILKSIRPRFLRAEALVGLGEPDLTGYVYGIYWAVKPFLGKKCRMTVTPDFERRILEGEAVLGGRIMAATVLHHAVRVLLDRRLRRLLDKMKRQE